MELSIYDLVQYFDETSIINCIHLLQKEIQCSVFVKNPETNHEKHDPSDNFSIQA
jgi:hypothetical protein